MTRKSETGAEEEATYFGRQLVDIPSKGSLRLFARTGLTLFHVTERVFQPGMPVTRRVCTVQVLDDIDPFKMPAESMIAGGGRDRAYPACIGRA